MNVKRSFKIAIDIIMTILFIVLMAYHVTGSKWHEWLGVALCVCFILHQLLNIQWYASLLKGRYSAIRILMITINALLLACVMGIMISGVMISYEVFGFLHLRTSMFARALHMLTTSWGYLLMAMHIGLHWAMLFGLAKKKLRCSNKRIEQILYIVTILIALYGIYAFYGRQLADRLFLRVHFAYFDYSEPALFFFADYVSILILFAAIAYYVAKFLRRSKQEGSEKV